MIQHILLHRQKINCVHLTAYSLHTSTREYSHKLLLLLRKKKSFIFNFPALRSECNLRIFWYLITFLHGSSGDYWNLRKFDDRITTFFLCGEKVLLKVAGENALSLYTVNACTDLFAVIATFLWQTTETVPGVAPLPGSTTISHSAESLGRAALNDRPVFTAALKNYMYIQYIV